MKIIRMVELAYEKPLEKMYAQQPHLLTASYQEQFNAIYALDLAYGSEWCTVMESLGYEVEQCFFTCQHLQQTWAVENDIPYRQESGLWRIDIALAQARAAKASIIFFQGNGFGNANPREEWEAAVPTARLFVIHNGFPMPPSTMAFADLLFVCAPAIIDHYEAAGLSPRLLYHFFKPSAIAGLDPNAVCEDPAYFSFCGSSGFGHALHKRRFWTLFHLAKERPLQMWLSEPPGNAEELKQSLLMLRAGVLGKNFDLPTTFPLGKVFKNQTHSPVFGSDLIKILRQSQITFNIHTDASGNTVGNMRLFEATGAGTCLLTDDGINLGDLFKRDQEVVAFASLEELLEKSKYLLENPSVCREIARRGRERTLRSHTVQSRCRQIHEQLQECLRLKKI